MDLGAILFDKVGKGKSVTLGVDIGDGACEGAGQGKGKRNEGELHDDGLYENMVLHG